VVVSPPSMRPLHLASSDDAIQDDLVPKKRHPSRPRNRSSTIL
jgi:hypothetical protein